MCWFKKIRNKDKGEKKMKVRELLKVIIDTNFNGRGLNLGEVSIRDSNLKTEEFTYEELLERDDLLDLEVNILVSCRLPEKIYYPGSITISVFNELIPKS